MSKKEFKAQLTGEERSGMSEYWMPFPKEDFDPRKGFVVNLIGIIALITTFVCFPIGVIMFFTWFIIWIVGYENRKN